MVNTFCYLFEPLGRYITMYIYWFDLFFFIATYYSVYNLIFSPEIVYIIDNIALHKNSSLFLQNINLCQNNRSHMSSFFCIYWTNSRLFYMCFRILKWVKRLTWRQGYVGSVQQLEPRQRWLKSHHIETWTGRFAKWEQQSWITKNKRGY